MLNKYCLLTCLLCLLISLSVSAQGQEVWFHRDKPFYVSGETMWFKLYLPPTYSYNRPTLRVDVQDEQGRNRGYFFLRPDGGAFADGYLEIPYDWPAGIYRLSFSGMKADTRELVTLYHTAIPVLSDFGGSATGSWPVTEAPSGKLQVKVRISEEQISAREEVQLQIEVLDQTGSPVAASASVAVIDEKLAGSEVVATVAAAEAPVLSLLDTLYYNGQVTTATDAPLSSSLLASFGTEDQRLNFSTANQQGQFLLMLPAFYGRKRIQFFDFAVPQIRTRLQHTVPQLSSDQEPLAAAPDLTGYLSLSRKRKNIYRLYQSFEMPVSTENRPLAVQVLPWDRRFKVDQYESFPTMSTFFREVGNSLRLRKTKKGYTARLYNPLKQRWFEEGPLFIIDGKVTRDKDFIAQLPPAQIDSVYFFHDTRTLRRYFPAVGQRGVVGIRTKEAGYQFPEADAVNIHLIQGLQQPAAFPLPDLGGDGAVIPYLRPQLYWNSRLKTGPDGKVSAGFPQSDDKSRFRVEVVAQTPDGRRGRAVIRYEVE